MKNTFLTISIMVFLISGSSYAQRGDLVLMFSAKDIETNIPVPLESVFINNITKGCDTTLYDEAPYLYLEWPSGIDDNNISNNNPFSLQPNYPNPFSVTTNIKISVMGKENLRFILYDINGIANSEFEKELNNGLHTFEIGVGTSKICFLLVSNGKVTKSIKLVSNVTESLSNQGITYIGRDDIGYKSTEEIESFEFSPGDQLLMKASASGYYDSILYDYPNENTNYIFELQNETIISFPTVTTSSLTDITQNSATCGGNVTDDGGEDVTTRGVCWSISQNPTISDNYTVNGSGTGAFTGYLTSLSQNTTYYVRAYATNSVGTAYGNEISFTTWNDPCGGLTTVSYEGQTYNIVSIGNQCWMSENLNYETTNSWWYSNGDIYGRLYTWEAALTACPGGWSLPSDDEWKTMEMALGMSQSEADDTGWRGTDEGGKMKETGTTHWNSPNTGATNSSGFTALPGGNRHYSGLFHRLGDNGYWWSSTEQSGTGAWSRELYYDHYQVSRYTNDKEYGFSVRCIKD